MHSGFSGTVTWIGGFITDFYGSHVSVLFGGIVLSLASVVYFLIGVKIINTEAW